MKNILLVVAILASFAASAQKFGKKASADNLAQFWTSTTYIVATNDNIVLDAIIGSVIKKHWTITPYKVISTKEFIELRKNPKNSFLTMTTVLDGAGKTKTKYLYLTALMGSEEAKSSIDAMPEIVGVPFACDIKTEELSDEAMIEPCILFIQKHIQNLKEKAFSDRLLASFQQPLEAYNYDMDGLKGKTIYMRTSDVDAQSEMKAAEEKYGKKFKFVNNEEFTEVINNKDSSTVVALSVYPKENNKGAYAYKMAMGLDGALYYFYYEKKPKNFLFKKKDFESMAKE
ncbi:MAG: hypothetical protein ACRC9X_01915 [Bacteroidales bacterium]